MTIDHDRLREGILVVSVDSLRRGIEQGLCIGMQGDGRGCGRAVLEHGGFRQLLLVVRAVVVKQSLRIRFAVALLGGAENL
jgi:hypothetical protein